jgi:hypothetical protein
VNQLWRLGLTGVVPPQPRWSALLFVTAFTVCIVVADASLRDWALSSITTLCVYLAWYPEAGWQYPFKSHFEFIYYVYVYVNS